MDEIVVMVADDAGLMRKAVTMTLAEIDINNVIEATNGEEAVALYEEKRPDLVLLDISMPVKNGLDALEEIMKIDPEARIIMCTAIDQQQTAIEALSAGASDYIIKPFQKDMLIESVRTVLHLD